MMRPEQERFDALVAEAVENLPPKLRELLDEVPLVVLDLPTRTMLAEVGMDPDDAEAARELCGMHSGVPETEFSFDAPPLPSTIHLFREGIVDLAGGWAVRPEATEEDEVGPGGDDAIYEEIMVTLLHEIGHQFGLSEEDLDELGYS